MRLRVSWITEYSSPSPVIMWNCFEWTPFLAFNSSFLSKSEWNWMNSEHVCNSEGIETEVQSHNPKGECERNLRISCWSLANPHCLLKQWITVMRIVLSTYCCYKWVYYLSRFPNLVCESLCYIWYIWYIPDWDGQGK